MWMSETWSTRIGRMPRREDRHLDPSQPEGTDFEAGRVRHSAPRRLPQFPGGSHNERACGPWSQRRPSRPRKSRGRAAHARMAHSAVMTTTLKQRLQEDLTAAIRSRDELRSATLRLTLSAVTTEEVAGKTARELSDDEVQKVIAREAKKRREAAEAFAQGGRAEQAERERAEGEVLAEYLPAAAHRRRAHRDRRRGGDGGDRRRGRGAACDGCRHEDRQPEGRRPRRGRPGRRHREAPARGG